MTENYSVKHQLGFKSNSRIKVQNSTVLTFFSTAGVPSSTTRALSRSIKVIIHKSTHNESLKSRARQN